MENLSDEIEGYKTLYLTFLEKTGLKIPNGHRESCSISELLDQATSFGCSHPKNDHISNQASDDFTIVFDPELEKKILAPFQTCETNIQHSSDFAESYFVSYNFEERKALYDYCLANAKRIQKPPELSLDIDQDLPINEKELSTIEKMKMQRDQKRRRQAYRNKVSTKNKSYTEVTREMISNVMEILTLQSEAQKPRKMKNRSSHHKSNISALKCDEDTHHRYHKKNKHKDYDREKTKKRRHEERKSSHKSPKHQRRY